MRLPILLLAVCFALEPAVAAETAWHSRDGKPIPDTESRKSANGFGASLVVTPNEDCCMEGELKGNPAFVRLAAPVLKFVGEPQDPLGEWRVEVSVKDVLRQTSLHLKTS